MKQVKWGIIGCGDVCERKSGPAFYKLPQSELLAVMRRNPLKAEDFANRHQVEHWFTTAGELLSIKEIDAAYIATPPAYHHHYTCLAADYGKHVYVEKPMAKNYDECVDMINYCREKGVKLWIAYYRRALEKFRLIKSLLENEEIGEVRHVESRFFRDFVIKDAEVPWRVKPEISGGGLFYDVGCHLLDALSFFFGKIEEVQGKAYNRAKRYNAADLIYASYRFSTGITGNGIWDFANTGRLDEHNIYGSHGILRFANHGTGAIEIIKKGRSSLHNFNQPEHIEQDFISDVNQQLMSLKEYQSNAEEAAHINWLMEEITSNYYTSR